MFLDSTYLLYMALPLLLGLWAQFRVQGTFRQYTKVRTANGMTGAQVARQILDANGLQGVAVERVGGMLSDHYDPRGKVLRLSEAVYATPSVAAVGVAAHEAGHALQDKLHYSPLRLRSTLVPAVNFGSWLGPIIFMVGFFMSGATGNAIAWFGLLLFGTTALFALVTLPVEFDASKRARQQLAVSGMFSPQEIKGVGQVLDAAALTYVAAAVQAVATMLYYLSLLSRRD